MANFALNEQIWHGRAREPGTPWRYLVKQGTGISFVQCLKPDLLPDTLFFPDSDVFQKFCEIYHINGTGFPPEPFKRAYKALIRNPEEMVPWDSCMSQKRFYELLMAYANDLSDQMDRYDLTYWNTIGQRLTKFVSYDTFRSVHVDFFVHTDVAKIQKHLATATQSQQELLKSFIPEKGESRAYCHYTNTGTKTGRLKVVEGANILLLKKEYRDIMVSQFGSEGKLWYFDYASLEPRILLAMKHILSAAESPNLLIGNLPQDVYIQALTDLGLKDKVPRNIVKVAILSSLYGQSEENTVKQLEDFVEQPLDFIRSLNDYFGVDFLKQKLTEELKDNGGHFIYNFYGRPIFCEDTKPYALLNYFIQSTAVDVALLGFEAIKKRLQSLKLYDMIVPNLILHDAMIIDIHNYAAKAIPKLEEIGSTGILKFKHLNFCLKASPA